jgi:hypothetical protein
MPPDPGRGATLGLGARHAANAAGVRAGTAHYPRTILWGHVERRCHQQPAAGQARTPGRRGSRGRSGPRHVGPPIDVLATIGWLPQSVVDGWRRGRVECLERVAPVHPDKLAAAMEHLRGWPARPRRSCGCSRAARAIATRRLPAIPVRGAAGGLGARRPGALDEQAVKLAVVASVRHQDTAYDELLMAGVPATSPASRSGPPSTGSWPPGGTHRPRQKGKTMPTPSEESLAAAAAEAQPLRRLQAFTRWVGPGRKLTQTGRITLADARELVGLLGTGDVIDPKIGNRVFRTKSSEELRGITTVAEWAKASGLVRVTGGRLVQVKKHAGLLGRPLELWTRMFEAFPRLGEALCVSGWGESLLRDDFEEGIGAVLAAMARRGGALGLAEACALAWETVAPRYVLDDLTDQQLTTARQLTDRDVRHALEVLGQLGAVRLDDGESVALTELALRSVRRRLDVPAPGDPVFQVKITLAGATKPPVWRRLLVPAEIRLDRLHEVIQAAMGWANYHMHVFSAGQVNYGRPDPELAFRDERKATLGDLARGQGGRVRYTYDFGDDWEHEVVVEKLLAAEPGVRYPLCVAGKGACPPEDCGGVWGYAHLREVLADPADEEHDDMLAWLGLEKATDFDPYRFDVEQANRALSLAGAAR